MSRRKLKANYYKLITGKLEILNKNINDRQPSWLDAQKAARPLYWR
jgi:hypothetical protein